MTTARAQRVGHREIVAPDTLLPPARLVASQTRPRGFGAVDFKEEPFVRIGYLVPEFPSQTHAFFWREVLALREMGHEVKLLSTRRGAESDSRHAFSTSATAETTYLASSPRLLGRALLSREAARRANEVTGYVKRCEAPNLKERLKLAGIAACGIGLGALVQREALDHVHVHSCADSAHLGAVQRLVSGVPYSLTLHGDLPVYGRNHGAKMRDAAFVAAVTRPLQQQVIDLMGWPTSRVPVLPMGVDVERFAPGAPSRARARSLSVLTVARLNPTKGHTFALQAVRRALDAGVDVQYTLAGEGVARSDIETEIARLGLESHVTMLGSVSEDEVLRLLHASDLLVLPSFGLGEAAPVAVMEAMACGLAVIATRIGGTPDMIDDQRTGFLVPQRDVDALANALLTLAQDSELRADLGRAARVHALDSFDFRANARSLAAQMEGLN